jgi:hypothetical protein
MSDFNGDFLQWFSSHLLMVMFSGFYSSLVVWRWYASVVLQCCYSRFMVIC